jgi:hypothetical protein
MDALCVSQGSLRLKLNCPLSERNYPVYQSVAFFFTTVQGETLLYLYKNPSFIQPKTNIP